MKSKNPQSLSHNKENLHPAPYKQTSTVDGRPLRLHLEQWTSYRFAYCSIPMLGLEWTEKCAA